MLDAEVLLTALGGDNPGDVELQPMQVQLAAASGDFRLQRRAEIVHVELRSLLRVLALDVHMLDGHRHGRFLLVICRLARSAERTIARSAVDSEHLVSGASRATTQQTPAAAKILRPP